MAVDLKNLDDVTEYLASYRTAGLYYQLAGALAKLRDTGIHEHHGCKNFFEFCDKAKIRQRTARKLMKTDEKLTSLGYTDDEKRELFDTFKSVLHEIANVLKRRVAISKLKKEYGGLKRAEVLGKLSGAETVTFTAYIPKTQHAKLTRVLTKKYGLVKKGKGLGNVSEAFGNMIDAVYKKT